MLSSLFRSAIRKPVLTPLRRVTKGATGAGGSFDADAEDYFARVEALGGNFDQTGINASYTETYVKTAISDFVAGCKTDSIWDLLTEVYLKIGVSFDGLMAKLKYDTVPLLSNTNFVSGDYVAAGSGAGLKGKPSAYLRTGVNGNDNATDSRSFSAYITEVGVSGTGPLVINNDSEFEGIWANAMYSPISSARFNRTAGTEFLTASRRAVNDVSYYANGSTVGTDTISPSFTGTSGEWRIFSNSDSSITNSTYRQSFLHIGSGLTNTEAANLSTRVNALMIALGTAVYGVVSNVQANGVNVTANGTQVTVTP